MAVMDYGAIAWKDGKCISTDMFTPMKDMVGWDDSDMGKTEPLSGHYMAYIGDEDLVIGFYKYVMHIHAPKWYESDKIIYFGSENFVDWKYWYDYMFIDGADGADEVRIEVRKKPFHSYYVCKMNYKGHDYEVAFGYGVDLDYYKRYGIIDAYSYPLELIRDIRYSIRRMARNIKRRFVR